MASASLRLPSVALLFVLAALSFPGRADAVAGSSCQALRVPVSVTGVPNAAVYGELCRPTVATNRVQLLVHGATYDHNYWNWPQDRPSYSYVQRAAAAGWATFNVDRIGTGQSSHPASTSVNMDTNSQALHRVVQGLRKGTIGGRPFKRVTWVGHSFGTLFGWLQAARYADIDAFVLTGMTHAAQPTWVQNAIANHYPAVLDPKFASSGLDSGYLTSKPGTRAGSFYYGPSADPNVIALDETLKQTVTVGELEGGIPLFDSPPAATAPSRAIRVPTLVVVGERDAMACASRCTAAMIRARETKYYAPQAGLQVYVAPATGHDLQLHRTAPTTTARILDWLKGVR